MYKYWAGTAGRGLQAGGRDLKGSSLVQNVAEFRMRE